MDQNAIIKTINHPDSVPLNQSPKENALQSLLHNPNPEAGLFSQLTSNPFFTAGFGLAALGAALRYGTQGLRAASSLIRHRLLVDLEITKHDESYNWVLEWMTTHYQSQLSPSSPSSPLQRLPLFESLIRRFTPGLHHLQIKTSTLKTPSGGDRTAFSLVPGQGRHLLRYRNAFISVNRERTGKSFDMNGQPFETISLTTLYSSRHIFEALFQEAHQLALRSTEGKTLVYTSRNISWEQTGHPKRRRPFDSVVLREGVAEGIAKDVREFLGARTWYLDRGIPYRRGYLLHGPPGTGKTSFVQALAGEMEFNIAMLSLSQRGLTDDALNHLLLNVPARTVVLLEDADAAFSNRRQRDGEGYSGANVTYSGLLNALDGVASAEERIVFMTTNHIERLDEALIRPGRVDMTVHLGNADEGQIGRLWERFYGEVDEGEEMKKRFVQKARECGIIGGVSTAALQGLFLYNKGDAEGAIAMVEQLKPLRSREVNGVKSTTGPL